MQDILIGLEITDAVFYLNKHGISYNIEHCLSNKQKQFDSQKVVAVQEREGVLTLVVCNFLCGVQNI